MVSVWPVSLPQKPLLSGLRRQPTSNVVHTSFEMGPPNARLRCTAAVEELDAPYKMDAVQLVTFQTYFKTTLAYGALPFVLPDPDSEGTLSVMFREGVYGRDELVDGIYRIMLPLLILP